MKKGLMFSVVLALLLLLAGCRYNPFHQHTVKIVKGFPATCQNPGMTDGRYCADCGETLVKQESTPAIGHKPIEMETVAATCTENGSTGGSICQVCNTILTAPKRINARGHQAISLQPVQATCMQKGLSGGSKCRDCGEILQAQKVVPKTDHTAMSIPAVEATCQSTGLTEGKKCRVCDLILVEQETVSKTGHVGIKVPAVEATCQKTGLTEGKNCKWCNKVMVAQKKTDKVGHKKVVVPAVLPTETADGRTQSIQCKWCDKVYLKAQDPDRYNSSYGYDYLGTLPNGKALQEMYRRLDLAVQRFHLDASVDAEYISDGDFYIMPFVDVKDLKIAVADIRIVMDTYGEEHQLYYWRGSHYYYYYLDSNLLEKVTYLVFPEYAKGKDRAEQNLRVYQKVQDMAVSSTSAYKLAKYYHDTILENMYYAYEKDGTTPEDAQWAHNIIGFIEYGAGVCECYAEMFHLLMNFSGVECIRVQGISNGEGHAWNMAKMDDGNWYWFDLTWDDHKKYYSYNYFCVNDSEKVNGDKDFLDDHKPDSSNPNADRFQYPIPDRSNKKYPK